MGLAFKRNYFVAPHAGAWIEMPIIQLKLNDRNVAPHAGAWIEMVEHTKHIKKILHVAPHAGAWIEMS